MDRLNAVATPIQELHSERFSDKGVRLFLKRDDLLLDKKAPDFNGNKWRKMKYNLIAAREQGKDTLLTFGGAYSNHIAATAAAAYLFGFKSVGIIRGERPAVLNPTLKKVLEYGMLLEFVSRSTYREKNDPEFINCLHEKYGDFYLLPEGGTNGLALKGCAEMVDEIEADFHSFMPDQSLPDYICCACGTGGTFAGIVSGIQRRTKARGYAALKGGFHTTEVENLLKKYTGIQFAEGVQKNVSFAGACPDPKEEPARLAHFSEPSQFADWEICDDYHFGGFAKHQPHLIDFINQFKKTYHIQLEPLYTGKMLFGIFDQIEKGYFDEGSTLLAIHTGGLQGIGGFNERFGDLLDL